MDAVANGEGEAEKKRGPRIEPCSTAAVGQEEEPLKETEKEESGKPEELGLCEVLEAKRKTCIRGGLRDGRSVSETVDRPVQCLAVGLGPCRTLVT